MRAAVLLAFLLIPSLALSRESEVPDALSRAVRMYPLMGWGAPLSGGRILTAQHVIAGRTDVRWGFANGTPGGLAEVVCEDKVRDIAILRTNAALPAPMLVAKKRPEIQERLWWRGLLLAPSFEPTVSRGYFLGDFEKGWLLDGWVYPGASGSPVVNDLGEIVGVMRGTRNITAVQADEMPSPAQNLAGLFRPLGYAGDPRGGPCGVR